MLVALARPATFYYTLQQHTTTLLELVVVAKSAPIGFRIDDEIKEALKNAAAADDRSVSAMVTIILRDYLREKGFLK